ncbi:RNase H domain-containing protein [Aphis craccivora]|uniref:RNase H domain-containing protein n=1 Tax=Aphis craccivora TaxID=307492 RepID=A0A6G0YXL0_APHCR|nr:RNase H domain-containing protein [Aphis craccivora]
MTWQMAISSQFKQTTRSHSNPSENRPFIFNIFLLISKDPPPLCNKCQEDLTIQHIILDCPDLQNIRSTLSIPNNLEEALNEDNTIQILNFLTKINILLM